MNKREEKRRIDNNRDAIWIERMIERKGGKVKEKGKEKKRERARERGRDILMEKVYLRMRLIERKRENAIERRESREIESVTETNTR